MPIRGRKGRHGRNEGSLKGGSQKAVTGSAASPEVAEARKAALGEDEEADVDRSDEE